jgi:hypothetical protein
VVYNQGKRCSEVKVMVEKKEVNKGLSKAEKFMKAVDAIAEDKGLDDRSFRREVKRLLGRIEGG